MGFFVLVWLAFVIAGVVGYVMIVLAAWRGMKAHESIAESMKDISERMRSAP